MYGTNWSMLQYWLLTGPGQKPFAAASWPVAIAHPWHARGGTCTKIYQAVKRRCLLQHSWEFTASSWKATVKRNQAQLVRLVRKPVLPERWRQRKWVRVWVLHLTLQIPSWVFMWGLSYMSGRGKDFPNLYTDIPGVFFSQLKVWCQFQEQSSPEFQQFPSFFFSR